MVNFGTPLYEFLLRKTLEYSPNNASHLNSFDYLPELVAEAVNHKWHAENREIRPELICNPVTGWEYFTVAKYYMLAAKGYC